MILATLTYLITALQVISPAPVATQVPPVETVRLAGRSVPLVFSPSTVAPAPSLPSEYLSWPGWKNLGGPSATLANLFGSPHDWTPQEIADYHTLKDAPGATVWKERFFLITRCNILDRFANGTVNARRFSLESPQIDAVLQSIARFSARVLLLTKGAVKLEPEVTLISDPASDEATMGRDEISPEFLTQMLAPRVNGGSFDADDHVFRGPYHGIMVVDALARPVGPLAQFRVNGICATEIPYFAGDTPIIAGQMDFQIQRAWISQVKQRSADLGWSFAGNDTETIVTLPCPWSTLLRLDEPTAKERIERLGPPIIPAQDQAKIAFSEPIHTAPIAPPFQVTLVADRDRGTVLNILEGGVARTGGVSIPWKADVNLTQTPDLKFWAKSQSPDPIALGIQVPGKTIWVSLGADRLLTPNGDATTHFSLNFKPDGTWQSLQFSLGDLLKAAGSTEIKAIQIGVSPAANLAGRIQLEPIQVQFSDFELVATGPSALLSGTEDIPSAIFAMAKATSSNPEWVGNLKSSSRLVRLNAIMVFQRLKDLGAEVPLSDLSNDIDVQLAEQAVKSLGFQGTESARELLRKTLRFALSENVRGAAATALSSTQDPKVAAEMMPLLGARSVPARLALIRALTTLSTPESAIVRMAMLQQEDPAVKLAVVESVDPAQEYQIGKLRWAAVNEPSDAVRSAAAIKLIQSPLPGLATEGYQAVKDDSVWVRVQIVTWLGEHPSDLHRDALRQAVVDRSPQVRAATLSAFAKQEKPVNIQEIANVLNDAHPDVQLALIALSVKQGLPLPPETLSMLKSSKDPRVINALSP